MSDAARPPEDSRNTRIGRMAVEEGYLTSGQLEECRRLQEESGVHSSHLAGMLVERGFLTQQELEEMIAEDAASAGGETFGRYRLLRELGRGAMGKVYEAWDTELRRLVALKRLQPVGFGTETGPEEMDRLKQEAQAAARLSHPGIVSVFDVGEFGGEGYFTMQFVAGRTLGDVLFPSGRPALEVTLQRTVEAIRDVAAAVGAAHAQGVVHRDVKPANVLVDYGGHVHVADFGLAKQVRDSQAQSIRGTGAIVGTPKYMSPEQGFGEGKVGPASDVFSLGVMLYEAVTGRAPFEGELLIELLRATVQHDPARPSLAVRQTYPHRHVSRDLETIILKSLEKDPRRRYPDAGALADDLTRYLEGEPIRARPVGLLERWVRKGVKHGPLTATVGGGLLLLVVWGLREGMLSTDRERTQQEAQDALRSARRAQDVLIRWVQLGDVIEKMEQSFHDERISTRERRKLGNELWPRIEEFMEETPNDSVSQATMQALGGWARRLAGYEAEGREIMRQAQKEDPTLPYGLLMEALVDFSEYLEIQELPSLIIQDLRVRLGPQPEETEEMSRLREHMEKALGKAAEASVWGEGMSEDFRTALEAMRSVSAGRYEEAEKRLSKALGTGTMQVFRGEILLARGRLRYLLGRFEEAAQDVEKVAQKRPGDAGAHRLLGISLDAAGIRMQFQGDDPAATFRQASESLGQAIEIRPDDAALWVLRGNLRRDMGDLGGAAHDYDQALALRPRSASAFGGRAAVRYMEGKFEMAVSDYDEALKIGSHDAEAYSGRGLARRALVDLDGAIADYDEALRIRADDAWTLNNRGMAWFYKKDLNRALADFNASIAVDDRSSSALANRGLLKLKQGDYAGAIADSTRAIEIQPKFANPMYNRGIAHANQGVLLVRQGHRAKASEEWDLAIADYISALEMAPEDWPYRAEATAALEEVRRMAGQ